MTDTPLLTAEQFEQQLPDFPEAGRWHELTDGRVVMLQPPDLDHGTVVLNLTKAFGEWASKHPDAGYACHELGLLVSRSPDTIACPAVSYFNEGERFAEFDKRITDTRPAFVVEIASTNDRRSTMRERILSYHEWGVPEVWIIDPIDKVVRISPNGRATVLLADRHAIENRPALPDFSIPVKQLFAEPDWWK